MGEISVILFFLAGISVGSFLNVVIDRVPVGQSIVSPPSHCFGCGHPLAWKDMVPVLSYLLLRGKCRYCGAGFSPRSVIIELLTGLLVVVVWLRFGINSYLFIALIFIIIFIVIGGTDVENKTMPVLFYYGCTALALGLAALQPFTHAGITLGNALAGLAIGAGSVGLIWLVIKLAGRCVNAVNIVITGMIGSSIGFPQIVPVLVGTLLVSLIWQIIAGAIMRKSASAVPFAAILCCFAMIVILTG